MLPVLIVTVLITTASGMLQKTPFTSVQASADDPTGLPAVGAIWGPAFMRTAVLKDDDLQWIYPQPTGKEDVVKHNLQWLYPQPTGKEDVGKHDLQWLYPQPTDKEDAVIGFVSPNEVFWNKKDMYDYIQSAISESDDNVVVQIDPAAVEGKYLEVVSSKPISADAVKMMCHRYKTRPAFCHSMATTYHKFKLMYSMVKDVENGNLFPVVFTSHKGCTRHNKCSWVTHVNEIAVLDKRVV